MLVIGHRGAKGQEPENTLRAVNAALDAGVDGIEFDVQKLKSGEIILSHDITLDRRAKKHGFVADFTFDQIRKLDVGKGENIPLLSEVLDLIDRKAIAVIELAGVLSAAREVAEIIKEYIYEKNWEYSDFRVVSFMQHELVKFHNLIPQIQLGANISTIPIDYAAFAEKIPVSFIASEELYQMDDEFVKDAHRRGYDFYLYSINDPDYFERFASMGIDGFYTDFPKLFKKK